MQELIFASANKYKAREIEAALPPQFRILIMQEAGITQEIPEPFTTLEENSAHKAAFLYQQLNKDCFSEDTGLEVEVLNGEPGVKSARYAGEDKSFEKNIEKLMLNMEAQSNRNARFRTVFTLIFDGQQYQFEGICNGMITEKSSGSGGFGYDPVFLPEGSKLTFAEMTMEQKNEYSHRKKGLDKMIKFLENKQSQNS